MYSCAEDIAITCASFACSLFLSSQRAASGGDLGAASILPAIAIVCLAVSWLVAEEVEPPQTLTKVIVVVVALSAGRGVVIGVGRWCTW